MDDSNVSEVGSRQLCPAALASAVSVGSDLAESLVTTWLALARNARAESIAIAGAALDWAEAAHRSAFSVARDVLARVDAASRSTLDASDSMAGALAAAVRDSSATVSGLVSRTASASPDGEERRAA